jgi:hypothetical protein
MLINVQKDRVRCCWGQMSMLWRQKIAKLDLRDFGDGEQGVDETALFDVPFDFPADSPRFYHK